MTPVTENKKPLSYNESIISKKELVNDHDPRPLHYQFIIELPEQFEWEYLEQGPEVWRVAIEKK